MVDSYEIHTASNWRKTLRGIAVAPVVGLLGYSLIFTINQDPNSLPRIGIGAFLVLASLLTLGWRGIYIRLYTSSGFMRRVLIVGAGKAGHSLADIYRKLSPPPFLLIGFIDDDLKKQGKSHHGFAVLGTSKKLLDIIEDYHISDIVVAINGEIKGETFQTILDAQEKGIEIVRMPIMYEEMTQRVPVEHLESDWVIRSFVDQVRVSGMYELFKRLMDIVGRFAWAVDLFDYLSIFRTCDCYREWISLFFIHRKVWAKADVYSGSISFVPCGKMPKKMAKPNLPRSTIRE